MNWSRWPPWFCPFCFLSIGCCGLTTPQGSACSGGWRESQIALLFVIMASAFERMRLYQAEYGLSEQRLYPTAFMGWLAVVFVWFCLTVLRGHRERFAFGAMVAGFLLIAIASRCSIPTP